MKESDLNKTVTKINTELSFYIVYLKACFFLYEKKQNRFSHFIKQEACTYPELSFYIVQ
jgi:hypothetical protein